MQLIYIITCTDNTGRILSITARSTANSAFNMFHSMVQHTKDNFRDIIQNTYGDYPALPYTYANEVGFKAEIGNDKRKLIFSLHQVDLP